MKLPYTPLQAAVRHAEEDGQLAETPRRACPSSAARCTASSPRSARASARACASRTSSSRGGALPVSLSDSLRALKERGLVELAVAAGACFDGDAQAVGRRLGACLGRQPTGSTRSSARSARGSSAPARRSATAAWPPPRPRTRPPRSAARRCSPSRVPGGPARAAPGRLAPHARRARALPRRRDRRLAGRARGPGLAAHARRGRRHRLAARPAQGCRSSTWAGGRTTTRGSSRPHSPPGSLRGGWSPDGGASARPGGRPRDLEHLRRRP